MGQNELAREQFGSLRWDVFEEHLSEAEWLVERWESAALSSRYNLGELKNLIEKRLLAHVDALVLGGGEVADRLLWPFVTGEMEEGASKTTAAALGLLYGAGENGGGSRDDSSWKRVLRLADETEDPTRTATLRAAALFEAGAYDAEVRAFAVHSDVKGLDGILAVAGARMIDLSSAVARGLTSEDIGTRRAALLAALASDRDTHLRAVAWHLDPRQETDVRLAAMRTAVGWSLRVGWEACRELADQGEVDAVSVLGLVGSRTHLPALYEGLKRPKPYTALWALGLSGLPEAADAVLPFIHDKDETAARLALEAFMSITGLSLRSGDFSRAPAVPKDEEELPPLDEDLETDLVPRAVDELPLGNGEAIATWWSGARAAFGPQRYLYGAEYTGAAVRRALLEGPLRRYSSLALEVAIRTGSTVKVPPLRLGRVEVPELSRISFQAEPYWS
jgi:uncharacterized protein (TIGR02270 family)